MPSNDLGRPPAKGTGPDVDSIERRWKFIRSWIDKQALSGTEEAVLVTLALHKFLYGPKTRPGFRRLAIDAELPRRTAKHVVKDLEARGLIDYATGYVLAAHAMELEGRLGGGGADAG